MTRNETRIQALVRQIVFPDDRGWDNRSGVLYAANEERFTAAHFSQPLTTYAVGWQDPENILATLQAMAPEVQIGPRFEYKTAVNAEAFLSETDDIRAIGSPFKRVEYKSASVNARTHNKGLTIRLDRDAMVDGDEERAVARLTNRIYRSDLRRVIVVLLANDTNTSQTWDGSTVKDPDQEVMEEILASGDSRGIDANIVVYGPTAWSKRALSHRLQATAGGFASAGLTPEQLAGVLGVRRVVLCKERYQSDASTKTAIAGAYCFVYYVLDNAGKDDPSNIKRFVTPTGDGRVRVYREEHSKFIDISVEHYSTIACTCTLGIRSITAS
ncbi:MAG: hypothetical protein JXR37_09240 [Kiritimatiellae bacterium]|nr:hypothetical protein [Kiritimatiellia bacterium]